MDTEIKVPICLKCKHLIISTRCKAFTEGIPEEILSGEFDHRKEFPGQENKTLFEPIKKEK